MDKKEGRRKTQQFLLLAFLSVSRAAIIIPGEGKRCSIREGRGKNAPSLDRGGTCVHISAGPGHEGAEWLHGAEPASWAGGLRTLFSMMQTGEERERGRGGTRTSQGFGPLMCCPALQESWRHVPHPQAGAGNGAGQVVSGAGS